MGPLSIPAISFRGSRSVDDVSEANIIKNNYASVRTIFFQYKYTSNMEDEEQQIQLFLRFKVSWPLTYSILQAKKPEFDIMFAKMDKKSLDFVRNVSLQSRLPSSEWISDDPRSLGAYCEQFEAHLWRVWLSTCGKIRQEGW